MRTTLVFAIMLLFIACNNPQQIKEQDTGYRTIEGQTMGTYYRITYQDSLDRDIQVKIEKSLAELNAELSTYDSTTLISDFNQSNAIQFNVPLSARHFLTNLNKSAEVYRSSDGAFDPTVAPLVNYWGFGYTGSKPVTEVDSTKIKSMLD